MTSPSPGQIARYLKNQYYPNDEAYLYALADVMAREYRAIVDAGFILQLDCPDLALSRHMVFAHLSLDDFRKVITFVGSYTDIRGEHIYPELVAASDKKPLRIFLQDGRNDNNSRQGNNRKQ
jgi:methionine synthase II (cobalamin-independent)